MVVDSWMYFDHRERAATIGAIVEPIASRAIDVLVRDAGCFTGETTDAFRGKLD
jgi:hypothetical protein